jgi:hypothetical protein
VKELFEESVQRTKNSRRYAFKTRVIERVNPEESISRTNSMNSRKLKKYL